MAMLMIRHTHRRSGVEIGFFKCHFTLATPTALSHTGVVKKTPAALDAIAALGPNLADRIDAWRFLHPIWEGLFAGSTGG